MKYRPTLLGFNSAHDPSIEANLVVTSVIMMCTLPPRTSDVGCGLRQRAGAAVQLGVTGRMTGFKATNDAFMALERFDEWVTVMVSQE